LDIPETEHNDAFFTFAQSGKSSKEYKVAALTTE
jgi:hypothetical protein